MSRSAVRGLLCSLLVCLFILAGLHVPAAWGQSSSTGTISVTVLDPDGRTVPDAQLTLQDLSTNDVRRGTTQANGTYSFVNLSLGTYKLTVSKPGFDSSVFDSIAVHATQVTDLSATLKVGVATQTVEVHESETPLVETSSNAITSTIDMKQLEELPLNGRDVSQLAFLTPGYSGVPGNGNGTWNGLPVIAQGNNVDGVISSTSRMKFSGNQQPTIQARLEDMQEMTVQSDQLDLGTGFGATDMQVNFVTRRGSNSFHGRAFDNFQNSYLNANSWNNNAAGLPRNHLILNDFGGSVGGPILKNKLFFFASYAESKQPGGYTTTNNVLTPASQAGTFNFIGKDGAVHTVQLVGPGSVAASAGVNNTFNARVTSEITAINGVESLGGLTTNANDPAVDTLSFFVPSPITFYFPAVRVDYNVSQNVRINFAWNETKEDQPGNIAPWFPGSAFSSSEGEFLLNAYTAGFGLDWTIKPTLVNQFRGGFLYNYTNYGKGAAAPTAGSSVNVQWDMPGYNGNMSGDLFQGPTSQYYPLFNFSDNVTWQHGAHTFTFGGSWYREQDHYWNPPAGIVFANLGLVNGDPALNPIANALTNADATPAALSEGEQLYSVLTGDLGNGNGPIATVAYALNPSTKQYETNSTAPFVLDELQKAWGLFFQDSFRIKPNLTLNYGLRWDFTGDDHDLKNAYESVGTDGVFAVSGPGNFFKPGVLDGNQNPLFVASGHQYKPWNKSPQPQIGIAWSPQFTDGMMGKLTDQGQTVIRAGFSFRNYTEPYQFFWDAATDYGAFFYQNDQILDNPTPTGPGQVVPGSDLLQAGSANFPASAFQNLTPGYTTTFPEAGLTFSYPYQQIRNPGIALGAIDTNIKQPYTESWNLSVQRPLGRYNAIEVRYIGSRSVHQWLNLFTDEVNIFENGFLAQFKQAQANLATNAANGLTGSNATFADSGPGLVATPIFDQAFAGVGAAGGFQNANFITMLQGGSAGALATALAGGPGGNPTYFCNLVDANNAFPACAANGGYSGNPAGGTYPINFFQMNPLNTGQDVGYTTAAGYSNYNGLQIDFRQKQWHGMQFDVNYTWSHTLGINTQNSWTGVFNQFTLRNLRESYAPLPFDIRHSIHANGTYDLPFGTGKAYLNQNGLLNRVVGGWSVGTVVTLQTGEPYEVLGSPFNGTVGANLSTYNDFADSGVNLNGVTASQLQSSVGVYHVAGQPFVDLINPKYLNGSYITSNTTPGTIGAIPYLHGPRFFNQDIAITKAIPITERLRFTFQGEFLNAFNHPNFGLTPSNNVTSNSFGTSGPVFVGGSPTDGARAIELRANFEF
jgi:hypothetical protein